MSNNNSQSDTPSRSQAHVAMDIEEAMSVATAGALTAIVKRK
jgi:hypothetical protein